MHASLQMKACLVSYVAKLQQVELRADWNFRVQQHDHKKCPALPGIFDELLF
jgi:hypothetical protein